MTKAELIRMVAKNVGVPDTDAKIFFELLLKRISAVVAIGQSIFIKDFGYFHLIKGSIKKPVFSSKDNEVSEEAVELVLFSEDKDLRNSDTKGLVFNIPFFDEEDYHPIDSIFSLSIGKPLIPLRGVPFDNIYMPSSGYEYRRLIESKVEKIIASSEIAESEENFPTLVIDARSYNSNHVQLKWNDKLKIEPLDDHIDEIKLGAESNKKLSEYEKQTNELKNIAWDFGEDLSRQIEAESILDIADERINMDSTPKQKTEDAAQIREINIIDDNIKIQNQPEELNLAEENSESEKSLTDEVQLVEEIMLDQSSEKLIELLDNENEPEENLGQNIDEQFGSSIFETENENIDDKKDELSYEMVIEDSVTKVESLMDENVPTESELSDEEFWTSSSKYFEPYKPNTGKNAVEKITDIDQIVDPHNTSDYIDSDKKINEDIREVINNDVGLDSNFAFEESSVEIKSENQENTMYEEIEEDNIVIENSLEQKAEYFEPVKKKNLIPFIVFPLLVISLSVALYWYLEFYKKNEITPKPVQLTLKSGNSKIVQRNFDIPVTYPYLPKIKETTISEMSAQKNEDQKIKSEQNEVIKTEPKKTEEKKIEKDIPSQKINRTDVPVTSVIPPGKGLNVGNNIYKYGNYFVVQVAAFRSSSISENEAGKYRNKGYNAFVEAAEIPGRGNWYRVRVGNFNNKEEAQIFANKNVK